jgi:Arc/MetJ-type ribon-helix-helix transcriptional regulator
LPKKHKIYFKRGHIMPRVGLYLTEPQVNKLKDISNKTGLTVSDLIRRALDDWLERFEERERKKRKK